MKRPPSEKATINFWLTTFLDSILYKKFKNHIVQVEKWNCEEFMITSLEEGLFTHFHTLPVFWTFLYEDFVKSKKRGVIRNQR